MSEFKKKIIVNLKHKINEGNNPNSITKNFKSSNKNNSNTKIKNNNLIISGNNNPKEHKQNIKKTIFVERKIESSISSRNNKNKIKIGNSYHPSNKTVKKDINSFLNKKVDNKNIQNSNTHRVIRYNKDNKDNKNITENNNYLSNNIKENKIFAYENDDKNTEKNEIDFDVLINNNIIKNINEKEKERSTKDTPAEKSIDLCSFEQAPSYTSSNSLNKAFNGNSSSSKDIMSNLQTQNNVNYSRDRDRDMTSTNRINKKKVMIKNQIINFPVNIRNKNFAFSSIGYKPNSFFGGSILGYSLSHKKNKSKIYNILKDNLNDRKNNSANLRKRNTNIYKPKDIDSIDSISQKIIDKDKNYKKIKIKIELKNNINKNVMDNNKNNNLSKKLKSLKHFELNKNNWTVKNLDSNTHNSSTTLTNKKKGVNKSGLYSKKKELNINNLNNIFKKISTYNKLKKENNIQINKNNCKKKININYPIRLNYKEKYKESKNYNTINFGQNKQTNNRRNTTNEIISIQQNTSISSSSTKKFYNNSYMNNSNQTNNIINIVDLNSFKKIKNIQFLCKRGISFQRVKKLNQDNFFFFPNFLNKSDYYYIGVCDGHGLFGQNISSYLKEHLPRNLNQKFIMTNINDLQQENKAIISRIITHIYQITNKAMNEDERIDSSQSGSTCVSIIFTPQKLFCINVGDSRCVLGKCKTNKNNKEEWIPMNLSRDHTPSDNDERDRIIKCGGKVESLLDEEGNYVGPERVWINIENVSGLAMSRSFGDEILHRVGVIVDPEILEYFFVEEDKFIVIASDGIWEFMSSDEVVNIVKDYYNKNDINGALEYLYNESTKRWISKDGNVDDITVIIIFF